MTVIRNDLDSIRIVGVAFAGAFFVAAFILFVQAWYYSLINEEASRAGKTASLIEYEKQQTEKLSKARMTIEDAKKAVVTQLNR